MAEMSNPVIKADLSVGASVYPMAHWKELQRFQTGEESDPHQLFHLTDDVWEAWPYVRGGRPSEAARCRFRFGHLRSFLKPYVKWYCYQRLLGEGGNLSIYVVNLPYALRGADTFLCEQEVASLEELADPARFAALWEAQIKPYDAASGQRPQKAVKIQQTTRAFWQQLRVSFGAPSHIPPVASYVKRRPVEQAADRHQIIPLPVIRQLVNRLALHRDGVQPLNRYHHLRLCVLVLVFCLGRRIDEVLASPREHGPDGPLTTYPAKGEPIEEALWFRFHPNKAGPRDVVYISPEWRELALYCVRTLCVYSDEVRALAHPREQHLLILVSTWNWTTGRWAAEMPAIPQGEDLTQLRRPGEEQAHARSWPVDKRAAAISQVSFRWWLNGGQKKEQDKPGVLAQWKITEDGSEHGSIYHLRPHQARHTRQSALAQDPRLSLVTLQQDLNHRHRDMQFAYEHTLVEQHQLLLKKANEGLLFGKALTFLKKLLDWQSPEQHAAGASLSSWSAGQPQLLDARWRALVARSPHFFQFNRVPCGYCVLPQGPEGCTEYMNCLEAADEGCQWFVTEPGNEAMMGEIQDRVTAHQRAYQESKESGRVVQAQKYEVLKTRSEGMQGEVLRRSSQELRERLRARKQELEKEQSCHSE